MDTRKCILCGKDTNIRRKRCGACNTKIRRHRAKLAAIKFLGGKCKRCGWDGHPAAFEFHHSFGNKDFQIGSAGNKSWEVLKKELTKCELLCANCHQIEHSNRDDERFLAEVENYNGTKLEW